MSAADGDRADQLRTARPLLPGDRQMAKERAAATRVNFGDCQRQCQTLRLPFVSVINATTTSSSRRCVFRGRICRNRSSAQGAPSASRGTRNRFPETRVLMAHRASSTKRSARSWRRRPW